MATFCNELLFKHICISLEEIYDPMIHQIDISSRHTARTGSKHLFQVQKKLNLMDISPTQQKPNFFRLFEVISMFTDLYTHAHWLEPEILAC